MKKKLCRKKFNSAKSAESLTAPNALKLILICAIIVSRKRQAYIDSFLTEITKSFAFRGGSKPALFVYSLAKSSSFCYNFAMNVNLDILQNKSVLIAVSGGVDSMVMLDYFIRNYGGEFTVATVNHLIRENSGQDCAFVAEFCRQKGVSCQIIEIDVPDYCKSEKLSTETGARILRHQALREIAKGRIICLAHNANDQAETVLLHLLRGSGGAGGAGMKRFDENYFRPLLSVMREEIEDYAESHKIPFVTDQTNTDLTYTRNFLRHEIFPRLNKVNTNAVANLCKFADLLRADQDIFDGIIEVVFTKNPPAYYGGTATFSAEICRLASPISSRAVFRIFSQLGYDKDIEQKNVNDILSLAEKPVGKQISLPFGLIAQRDYGGITICPKSDTELEYVDSVDFGKGVFEVADKKVVVEKPREENARNGDSQNGLLWFDMKKIPQKAVFRTRREGDLFTKFGGGTKKLKDYLIDIKIPQKKRDELVLVAQGKQVLIIVGVEISEQVKCEQNSDIYKIYLKKE